MKSRLTSNISWLACETREKKALWPDKRMQFFFSSRHADVANDVAKVSIIWLNCA